MRKALCGGYLSFKSEELNELPLVETNNHVVSDEYNGYAHLAALINHFLTLLHIGCNIVLRVRNVILLEELLAHLAEVTSWGGVNSDSLLIHSVVL